MAFLTHDISMLRLFETFLENAPQLALLLYSVLRSNKAEPSQGAGPGWGVGLGGRGTAALLCCSALLLLRSHRRPFGAVLSQPRGPLRAMLGLQGSEAGGGGNVLSLGKVWAPLRVAPAAARERQEVGSEGRRNGGADAQSPRSRCFADGGLLSEVLGAVWSRTSPSLVCILHGCCSVAGMGICTAFLCVTWSLLDYHQSLRSFLQDKYEMGWGSSVIYFLWNLFLLCPRILALALFALLWPYGVAVHFPLVWLAMFLWVSLQGTDFMESPGPEQLYRAMVAVILYFSWFNVAPGRTLHRSVIYHSFILVDSTLLTLAWLWGRPPEEQHPLLIPALWAALPCYLLGLLLRVTYYGWLHPNVRAQLRSGGDEVDANGRADGMADGAVEFRSISEPCELRSVSEPVLVNSRLRCLARSHFPLSVLAEPHLLNGTAAV